MAGDLRCGALVRDDRAVHRAASSAALGQARRVISAPVRPISSAPSAPSRARGGPGTAALQHPGLAPGGNLEGRQTVGPCCRHPRPDRLARLQGSENPRKHHPFALPPGSLELTPIENVWQFIRDNWLSNRVFTSYNDILDHCCGAWNKLTQQPWTIMSIGLRNWAHQ